MRITSSGTRIPMQWATSMTARSEEIVYLWRYRPKSNGDDVRRISTGFLTQLRSRKDFLRTLTDAKYVVCSGSRC